MKSSGLGEAIPGLVCDALFTLGMVSGLTKASGYSSSAHPDKSIIYYRHRAEVGGSSGGSRACVTSSLRRNTALNLSSNRYLSQLLQPARRLMSSFLVLCATPNANGVSMPAQREHMRMSATSRIPAYAHAASTASAARLRGWSRTRRRIRRWRWWELHVHANAAKQLSSTTTAMPAW